MNFSARMLSFIPTQWVQWRYLPGQNLPGSLLLVLRRQTISLHVPHIEPIGAWFVATAIQSKF